MNRFVDRLVRFRGNRWVLYIYCLTIVSLTAACVYGWPALRQALRNEDEMVEEAKWSSESALGAAFTMGAWSTQGLRFFAGMARDRYGTRVVVVFCLFSVVMGSIGIAFANSPTTMGIALLCQGIGSGAQLCLQPFVAKLFPQHAGAVLASMSGGSQVSGLVYLSLTKAFISRQRGFLTHSGTIFVLAICAVVMLPQKPSAETLTLISSAEEYKSKSSVQDKPKLSPSADISDKRILDEEQPSESSFAKSMIQRMPSTISAKDMISSKDMTGMIEAVANTDIKDAEGERSGESAIDEGIEYDPKGTSNDAAKSAWSHVRTLKYLLLVQWFALVITPLQYYVGSIGFQLERKGDESGKYAELFTILYGSIAVLSPVGGLLADQYTLGLAQGISTLLVTLSFFMLISSASLQVQSVGLACNAIGRMWIFGTFSTHVAKVFGYRHFGTLAGLGLITSAVVSVLQYPLIAAAADGKADAMNWLSGCILAAELFYCFWLHRHGI